MPICLAHHAKSSAPLMKSSTTPESRRGIASMMRFQNEFEPLTKAEAERIEEEIETADHIKRLRAMRAA